MEDIEVFVCCSFSMKVRAWLPPKPPIPLPASPRASFTEARSPRGASLIKTP